jgi:exo-beta-1,3-glucanase (GH17 family)
MASAIRLIAVWVLIAGSLFAHERRPLIIYDEGQNASASLFHPGGWMPDGNGIAFQTDCTTNPRSGKTCIKFGFDSSANPWVGVYWLAGDSWGDEPGVDVYSMLGVAKGTRIELSFWARAETEAFIECKVGGVNKGKYPDSVPFARGTNYFRLGQDWVKRTIDLTDQDLANLVGGFCVVTDKAHNRDKKDVWFYLDDIVIEAIPAEESMAFDKQVGSLRWVAYCPTESDPVAMPPKIPSNESIRKDLELLRESFDGVITYGCSGGLENVPSIARRSGFRGIIQGVWDPTSAIESANVKRLASEGLIDAICCGNEGLNDRYDWAVLAAAIADLRTSTRLPVTTTEQIEDYGDERLISETAFVLVNVHPIWHNQRDVAAASAWFRQQLVSLASVARKKPILIKETGFPSAGGTGFSPETQKDFWEMARRVGSELGISIAAFEAFDAPWKHERYGDGDIGPHWGLFANDRTPKPAAAVFRSKRNE